jgi:hypothetical protein
MFKEKFVERPAGLLDLVYAADSKDLAGLVDSTGMLERIGSVNVGDFVGLRNIAGSPRYAGLVCFPGML